MTTSRDRDPRQPAGAQHAEAVHDQLTTLARAIVSIADGEPDVDAIEFARRLSAAGKTTADLAAFMERRDQARRENALMLGPAADAHPELRPIRNEMYRQNVESGRNFG